MDPNANDLDLRLQNGLPTLSATPQQQGSVFAQPGAPALNLATELISLAHRIPQLATQQAGPAALPGQAALAGGGPANMQVLLHLLLQRQLQEQQQRMLQPSYGAVQPMGAAGLLGLQPIAAAAAAPLAAVYPEPQQPPSQRAHSGDEVPFSLGPTGLKIRVVCNDVRGILYLDDQYVSCFCVDCESRVRAGHDRPIFGLSRFEKHCGSKAKKWRTSLRVEPGSCPEVKASDAPMPVGQFLALKGVGLKSKGGGKEGNDSDSEFMPVHRPKRPRTAATVAEPRAEVQSQPREVGQSAAAGAAAAIGSGIEPGVAATLAQMWQAGGSAARPQGGSGSSPKQRQHQVAESSDAQANHTANLAALHKSSQQGDQPSGWAQRQPAGSAAAAQGREQPAAAEAVSPPGTAGFSGMRSVGPLGSGGAVGEQGNSNLLIVTDSDPQVTGEWMQQQRQRFAGLQSQAQEPPQQPQQEPQQGDLSASSPAISSAKHAAIFRLVFGLLQGPNQRLFNEVYMPWLNDLPSERLEREFSCFASYLDMLEEMGWKVVWRQIMAYLQGALQRILMQARVPASLSATPTTKGGQLPSPPHSPPLEKDICSTPSGQQSRAEVVGERRIPKQEAQQQQQQQQRDGASTLPSSQPQQPQPQPLQPQLVVPPRVALAAAAADRGLSRISSQKGAGSAGTSPPGTSKATAFQPYSAVAAQQQQQEQAAWAGAGGAFSSLAGRAGAALQRSSSLNAAQAPGAFGQQAFSAGPASAQPASLAFEARPDPQLTALLPQLYGMLGALRTMQQQAQQQEQEEQQQAQQPGERPQQWPAQQGAAAPALLPGGSLAPHPASLVSRLAGWQQGRASPSPPEPSAAGGPVVLSQPGGWAGAAGLAILREGLLARGSEAKEPGQAGSREATPKAFTRPVPSSPEAAGAAEAAAAASTGLRECGSAQAAAAGDVEGERAAKRARLGAAEGGEANSPATAASSGSSPVGKPGSAGRDGSPQAVAKSARATASPSGQAEQQGQAGQVEAASHAVVVAAAESSPRQSSGGAAANKAEVSEG